MKLATIALCLLMCGCGGSSHTSASMTGAWAMTLTPDAFPGDAFTAATSLTQTQNAVTGTLTLPFDNPGCGTTAALTGSVSSGVAAFVITQSGSSLDLSGAVNSSFTSGSGSYTASTGQCLQNGGTGTWRATKQ